MTRLEKLIDVVIMLRLTDRYREYPLPNLVGVANDIVAECEKANHFTADRNVLEGWLSTVRVTHTLDAETVMHAIAGMSAAAGVKQ